MREKNPLVLRQIGGLNLLVCPKRVYGENLYALNQSAAEIFRLWAVGCTAAQAVERLSQQFSVPDGFYEQAKLCMAEFEKLARGETSLYFGPLASEAGDFGTDETFWEKRIPVYGGIEPTWRCNLNCCHCYIKNPLKETLSIADWETILDQLAEAGCLHLAITGGEPLFYKDFKALYRKAVLSGFLVTVFTNATLLDESMAALFAEYPPRRLEISIYGAYEKTYEAVTGVRGSYKRFIQGLDLLAQHSRRVPVILKSVLLHENVAEREEIQKIALDRGMALAQNSLIRPRIDGNAGPELHRLSPEIVAKTEMEIKPDFDAWDEFAITSTPIARHSEIVDCSAGNVAFQIDPLGDLGYCVIARAPGINLLETPMRQAWEILGSERAHYFRKPERCMTCEDARFCDYCPGYQFLESQSADLSDGDQAYHCAVAKARHKLFIMEKSRKEGITDAKT